MSRERVGILGGTFDPPHNAHMTMARMALDRLSLDRVLFMPAPSPPHKDATSVSSYEKRVRMVELMIGEQSGMGLSRMEEFRAGPSYTVDLLLRYRTTRDDDLFLIVGADSVADLPQWKNPEEILRLATLVVFPRSGFPANVPVAGKAAIVLFEEPIIDISSSDIRRRVRAGQSVESLVPDVVHRFILDESLYC